MGYLDDVKNSASGGGGIGGVVGTVAGTMMGGPIGTYVGGKVGSGIGQQVSSAAGFDNSKQKDLADQSATVSAEEAARIRERTQWMEENDRKYQGQLSGYGDQYLKDLDSVRNQARDQATDAQKTYSSDIQPRMKNIMEDAQQQAGQAMSLADAGNVNNSVQTGVRGLYDQMGQGVQKQGIADYGVLSALGSQATQNTMGAGGPMTGAQMQLLNAGNQSQAGQAFQRAQANVQRLKEQGLEKGFEESGRQYDRGVNARSNYAQSVGNYEGAMDRNIGRQKNARDEEMGYSSDRFGTQRGLAQEQLGVEQGIRNRDIGALSAEYGNRQGILANQTAMANADNAQKRGILGGIIQAGATGAGAYFGGAQGAQAGAQGSQGIATSMQPMNSYGSYGQQQRSYA